MNHKITLPIALMFTLSACTTGQLYYQDQAGNRVMGCNVEFVGMPSVDKFAVEYALSHCAKSAVEKGYSLDPQQAYLVELDLTIPEAPCGQSWNHELAEREYEKGNLSKKEYGYLVAYIDLGWAAINLNRHSQSDYSVCY